jgi:hypothetical protein
VEKIPSHEAGVHAEATISTAKAPTMPNPAHNSTLWVSHDGHGKYTRSQTNWRVQTRAGGGNEWTQAEKFDEL